MVHGIFISLIFLEKQIGCDTEFVCALFSRSKFKLYVHRCSVMIKL